MHLILPAVETVQELQRSIHTYLKRYDNPLIQQHAEVLDANNRQELLYRQAIVLTARLQFYRFCLTRLNRRGLAVTDPQKQALVNELWDETERYGSLHEHDIRQFNAAMLDRYIAEISATVERLTHHIRVKGAELRRLGDLPQIPTDTIVLTEDQCRQIVRAITEDILNEKLRWQPQSPEDYPLTHATMQQFFSQWDAKDEQHASRLSKEQVAVWREQAVEATNHFFQHVLQPVIRKLFQLISSVIPEHTWLTWTVRDVGLDLVLVQGQDWRILDWTRRVESGEWEGPKTQLVETLQPDYQEVIVATEEILEKADRRNNALTGLGLDPTLFATVDIAPTPEIFQVKRSSKGKRERV